MRGIAILAVMIFHAAPTYLKGGYIGVDIFFVLSGFLITSIIIKEYDKNNNINFKNFYMRRVLRLAPALILLLLTVSILSLIFLNTLDAKSNINDALIAFFYASNWARALHIDSVGYFAHTWSLSIEEQFYIIWPLTLILMLKRNVKRIHIVLSLITFSLIAWALRITLLLNEYSVERIYNGLDARADSLLIGCALAITLSSNLLNPVHFSKISKALKFAAPISAFTFTLLLIAYTLGWESMHLYYWGFVVVELCTAILILDIFTSENKLLKNIFTNKIIVWVGSISYGLYLWHYPIYEFLKLYTDNGLLRFIIGSIITFIITAASYYYVEKKFLKMKYKFS